MTKADGHFLGYVPCVDPIDVHKRQAKKEANNKENEGRPMVTFAGISPSNSYAGSMASEQSDRSSNRSSSDCERLYDELNDSATSDELHQKLTHQKNCANLASSKDGQPTIPNSDLNCDVTDSCPQCQELKKQGNDTSETTFLQGNRCQLHAELNKSTAILSKDTKKAARSNLCEPPKAKVISSPARSPLSNLDSRKRTPSGGSVIKQIQVAIEREEEEAKAAWRSCSCPWTTYFAMFALLLANLLNYMDRYTIAGVLLQVQEYYQISNAEAGLLQTSFILSYMLFSPLFGFLGDRFNRKKLMAFGILFWSVITLAGSFIPRDRFWLFLFMRALVGIGEASYSTIAPTIIADLFVKDMRSKALSVFYFAIPVGSGLGYIVGGNVAKVMGDWQWALRVTPGLGVLCVVLIMLVVKEPPRGHAEGGAHLSSTSYWQDLKYLSKNKSFMLSSAGFTCVAFCAGALALWCPAFIDYSIRVQGEPMDTSRVSLYFGIITCAAGFLGVAIGSESARRLRKTNPRADPLVCAFGLIVGAPFFWMVLYVSKFNTTATWILIFIGETLLCLNWAIVTDILLYIVIPTRRSSAEAFQILMSHALGDAGSPYLLGAMSDALQLSKNDSMQKYLSLQYSLYMTSFVAVLGGGFFLATALYVEDDRARADKVIKRALAACASSKDNSPAAVAAVAAAGDSAAAPRAEDEEPLQAKTLVLTADQTNGSAAIPV